MAITLLSKGLREGHYKGREPPFSVECLQPPQCVDYKFESVDSKTKVVGGLPNMPCRQDEQISNKRCVNETVDGVKRRCEQWLCPSGGNW